MVALPTLTSDSLLDENGSDTDPMAPTPTLAELLVLRNA